MKLHIKLWMLLLFFAMPTIGFSSNIDYCPGTQATTEEDAVIQRLVPQFGNILGCEIGDNCLEKWNNKEQAGFAIAWKKRCGPVIHRRHVLGDKGRGSSFICKPKGKNAVCCWPSGYQRIKSFILCSDTIR